VRVRGKESESAVVAAAAGAEAPKQLARETSTGSSTEQQPSNSSESGQKGTRADGQSEPRLAGRTVGK